jgi:DNA-binding XRE family transcriptional regulator
MGRPSSFKHEFAGQAAKLCRLGATDAELADFFAVSEQTINAWKKAHPEFLESLKEGKQLADAEIADKLYQRAQGYTHKAVKIFNDGGKEMIVGYDEHYPPDTTACIFWLKNRRPDLWRDKHDHELAGKDGGPMKMVVEWGND